MVRVEFEKLMELSRKTITEKPKSELLVLAMIFFNGGKIGIREIKEKIKSEYSTGWFSIEPEELEEVIPKLVSKNVLHVEQATYIIPGNLLSVLKDIIEENLFPERDEVLRIFERMEDKLKDKLKEIVSHLKDGRFYYYRDEEVPILREIEKYGLIIFARSYFISGESTNFGDKCVFVHPTVTFSVRSELFKNGIFQLASIHQEELFLLRKEKRDLMEKVLIQQDRINSLYEENINLRQKIQNLEEFQRGMTTGVFLKNMIIFRLKTFQRTSSLNELLREWEKAESHDQMVNVFSKIMYLFGLDYHIISKKAKAEPDILGISYNSMPPFLILVEVKTIRGEKQLGSREVSQVISKVKRYKEMYRGFHICPIILTNVEAEKISEEAIRDSVHNVVILTKKFVVELVKSHFKYMHSPTILYTLLEPKKEPIPTAEDIKFMNVLSEQENLRMSKEVISYD